MAQLTSELILTMDDRVSAPARAVNRSLESVKRQEGRYAGLGQRLTTVNQKMASSMGLVVGPTLAAGGAIAASMGAGAVVSGAADFESALTEIQKKAGTTTEQTRALGEEIKSLATSGELAVPIEEIAAAYERGAAAGIPIGELREFAALSVKAADGFGMSAEAVGNFAAKLKTGLGMSEDQVRRVFDLTNSLADAGIADESAIVDYIDRVGASLKTLGMNAGQSLALGATMLNLGMTSDVAATATDALVNKLLTVSTLTGAKRKTFEKYMGSVEDFSAAVGEDANGALTAMLDKLKDLDATERMDFLSQFVGQEHAGKILRIVEAIKEYRENLALANDEAKWFGSLDSAYKLKLDDFWSQWRLVKNALEKLTIDAGTAGLPLMKQGLEGLISLIGQIDQGLKSMAVEIDWKGLQETKQAFGELGTEVAELLGIDTEGSTLAQFFKDLAGVINDVSAATRAVVGELKDVAAFARDPIGFMRDASRDEQRMRDHGITPITPERREQLIREKDQRERRVEDAAQSDRRTALDDYLDGGGQVSERSPPAEIGGRLSPTVRAPAPNMMPFDPASPSREPARPGPGSTNDRLAASMNDLAAALRAQREALQPGAARGVPAGTEGQGAAPTPAPRVPIPTPRPDILGPVEREGEAAAVKAQEIGSRIQDAFSVTATPRIDTSQIQAARREAEGLLGTLRQIDQAADNAVAAQRRTNDIVKNLSRELRTELDGGHWNGVWRVS